MEFIHLEGREGQKSAFHNIERLARRQRVRPVTGAHVVGGVGTKTARRSEEAVNEADGGAFALPTQDETHVVGICESAATAKIAVDVGGKLFRAKGRVAAAEYRAP